MWDALRAVLHDDFAAPDGATIARAVVRVVLALALAGLIGLERERRGAPAGLRTHMLLALGVALIVVAAGAHGLGADALARVLQGVLVGVGFIGGGAILKENQREVVKGLTTAASLWATAAIAATAALGEGLIAVAAAVLALVILALLRRVETVTGLRRAGEDR